jgi:hypothetical protein
MTVISGCLKRKSISGKRLISVGKDVLGDRIFQKCS